MIYRFMINWLPAEFCFSLIETKYKNYSQQLPKQISCLSSGHTTLVSVSIVTGDFSLVQILDQKIAVLGTSPTIKTGGI